MRLQDQILGSTAIFGFSDTQMYLASPEEIGERYYAFLWHPHGARPETFHLSRDERGLFVPYAGTSDEGNCERVLALIPEDGAEISFVELRRVALAVPLSSATLKRVLQTLIERERIVRVRHGSYRRVPVM